MHIKELHLDGFGKFEDFKVDFDSKINLIYGENEAGKSTLNHFMVAMFADEQSHQAFERFSPWHLDQRFGGKLKAVVDGKDLTIDKDFVREASSSQYLIGDGMVERAELGYSLPITALTTYKLSNFVGKHLVADLKQKLSNKTVTNSEDIDVASVFNQLDEFAFSSEINDKLRQIENDKTELSLIQTDIKFMHKELKLLYVHKLELEANYKEIKEALAENELKSNIESERETQNISERLHEIDQLINKKASEAQLSKVYMSVELSDYEAYLEIANKKERAEAKVAELKSKMDLLQGEVDSDKIALNKGYKFFDNEAYINDFTTELETYQKLNVSLKDLDEEINTRKERLYDSKQVIDRYEDSSLLERDYQKVLILKEKAANRNKKSVDEDKRSKLKNRQLILIILAGFFGLTGIALIVISAVNVLESEVALVIALDVGILFVFATIYTAYKLYRVQTELSQIEYEHLYNRRNSRQSNQSQSLGNSIDRIISKYDCDSVDALEALFMHSREAELENNLLTKEIGALDAKYLGYNNQMSNVKKNIERRMLQCEFESVLGEQSIEVIIDEFNAMRDVFNNVHVIADELKQMNTSVEAQNKAITELDEALNAPNNRLFEAHSYTEVFELKQNHIALNNEISLLRDEKFTLESGKSASKATIGLRQAHEALLESEIETALVIKTTESQIFDTEKLISKWHDKARYHKLALTVDTSIRSKQALATKVKSILTDNLDHLKVSMFPLINQEMNVLLSEITGKYQAINIDDQGDIVLLDKQSNKVNLEHLSLGTIDQIYFIIGISMIQNVFDEDESVPLILDDAFVQYDDDRFENVMKVINKLNRQVIIFTCYEREQEYLDKFDIPYNYIELTSDEEQMEG